MLVPLNSPRWQALRHAYGPASDVPDLIRAIQAEKTPDFRDGGIWFEVYSSLYHQHSTYSATYAAFPHLMEIAGTGTLWQRVAIMCLAGEILVYGHPDEAIPGDLLPDFESAMAMTKESSLKTIREAALASSTDNADGNWWNLGGLLLAFGGLRHPKSGYVVQLDYLVREGWNVEAECPSCRRVVIAELREKAITTLRPDGRGGKEPASGKKSAIDRSSYPGQIAKGLAILGRGGVDWALEDTPFVLAALAEELGNPLLAARILDLSAVVSCAYCGRRFELSNGLQPL